MESRGPFQFRHAPLELPGKHDGGGCHRQHVRYRLRQEHGEDLVGKEMGKDKDQGNQQDDLPQDGQEQGGLGMPRAIKVCWQAICTPKMPVAAM